MLFQLNYIYRFLYVTQQKSQNIDIKINIYSKQHWGNKHFGHPINVSRVVCAIVQLLTIRKEKQNKQGSISLHSLSYKYHLEKYEFICSPLFMDYIRQTGHSVTVNHSKTRRLNLKLVCNPGETHTATEKIMYTIDLSAGLYIL